MNSKELGRSREALASLQTDVRSREEDIADAIGLILATERLPVLERYQQVANEFRALRVELKALDLVLDPGRYDDQGAKSTEGARMVNDALIKGVIQPWDVERANPKARDRLDGHGGRDVEFDAHVAELRARVAALREQPT